MTRNTMATSVLYPCQALPLVEQPPVVLLAMCLFGEARGESEQGRRAVAQVAVNRARHAHAVFGSRRGRMLHENLVSVLTRPMQFSCFNPGDVNFPKLFDPLAHERAGVWANCMDIAGKSMESWKHPDTLTHNSDHYFDDSIQHPAWADPAKETVKIGRLRFFRLYLPALLAGAGMATPSGAGQPASAAPSLANSSPEAAPASGEALPTSLPAPPPPISRNPRYGLTRWLGGRELTSLEEGPQDAADPGQASRESQPGGASE